MARDLRSLERKLFKIPKQIERELRISMPIAAEKIIDQMERRVPERSGELKNSLTWVWGEEAPTGALAVGSLTHPTIDDLVITISAGDSDAFYARWVEFGREGMVARPFFYSGYRAGRRSAKTTINRAIKKGAQRAVK